VTKAEALWEFRRYWRQAVRENAVWRGDLIRCAEAWNCYTDSLCKDGQITLRQYESWTNPF
jgi:hypothetical protein